MAQSSSSPEPPTSPGGPSSSSGSRRSSSSAANAAGCDIESVGPNGEITWRRIPTKKAGNLYAEYPEFGRKRIEKLREAFEQFDSDRDGHLGLEDLKLMMERMKAPQTHLGLKGLIREFDTDNDGRLDFRGFLGLFRKAAAGQLDPSDPLQAWYAEYIGVGEVSVEEVGVRGARDFFEAKIAIEGAGDLVQAEIREEQRRKQAEEEAKRARKENFDSKRQLFNQC